MDECIARRTDRRAPTLTRSARAVATIATTSGSVPSEPGSKMLVYADGKISGTIGGGKFEALVKERRNTGGDPWKSNLAQRPIRCVKAKLIPSVRSAAVK